MVNKDLQALCKYCKGLNNHFESRISFFYRNIFGKDDFCSQIAAMAGINHLYTLTLKINSYFFNFIVGFGKQMNTAYNRIDFMLICHLFCIFHNIYKTSMRTAGNYHKTFRGCINKCRFIGIFTALRHRKFTQKYKVIRYTIRFF